LDRPGEHAGKGGDVITVAFQRQDRQEVGAPNHGLARASLDTGLVAMIQAPSARLFEAQ
jgi:hypothetical protein